MAERLNGQIASGDDPQAVKRTLRGELTLDELLQEYIDKHLIPRGRGTRNPESLYRNHFADWGSRKLSQIQATDVQKRHAEIGRKHPAAANRAVQTLRAMFNRASYWGYFEGANPAGRIDRFREHSRKRFLHPDEMARFIDALAGSPPAFQDFLLLCLFTGARRGNIQMMRWRDLELDRGVWQIPHTKNGEPHAVPLVREAVGLLRHRRRSIKGDWVFPSNGRSGHYEEPKRAWNSLLDRAGIEDLHIHDLRRTLGSWQAAEGASLSVIGETLGHKSPHSTAIYARLSLDPVRASLEAVIPKMLAAGDTSVGP